MARQTGLNLLGLAGVLLAILVVVPMLKRMFPQFYEGFINTRCERTTPCPEGTFCLKKADPSKGADAPGEETCEPIYV